MEDATNYVVYFQILPIQSLGVDSWPFKLPSSSTANYLKRSRNLSCVPKIT